MGIYEMKVGSNGYLNLYIKELPIYGSNRLGVIMPDSVLTYIYTINGWIKAVNSSTIDTNRDAGADGKSKLYYGTNGTPRYSNPNKFFALDAFSYSLEYNSLDYNPIKVTIPVSNLLTAIPAGSGYKIAVKDSGLYNGNITRTIVSMRQSGNSSPLITVAGYAYQYDRLNRIKLMQTCLDNSDKYVQTNNSWQGISVTTKYNNSYSYDANGNITKLRRYDNSGNLMDRLNYNYFSNSNKLKFVHDSAGTTSYAGDLEDQSHANYNYSQIGNMIKDSLSDANSITWTSYGKPSSIYKRNGKRYSLLYDALARRTVKYNQPLQVSTYATYDASGNIMGIYEMKVGSNGYLNLYIKELPIYGSSRLGVIMPNRALTYIGSTIIEHPQPNTHIFASTYCSRRYELTNHLGNVMVTIKDKRIAVDANSNGITDYYLPDVESTIDYYPFGQEMPGRVYSPTSYRFGFNGKENDNEVAGTGNWQNYGMREYDARVCRFISVDPLTKKYPELTPFQFSSNTPIWAIDLDGMEAWRTNNGEDQQLDPGEKNISGPLSAQTAKENNLGFYSNGEESVFKDIGISKALVERIKPYQENNQVPNNKEGCVGFTYDAVTNAYNDKGVDLKNLMGKDKYYKFKLLWYSNMEDSKWGETPEEYRGAGAAGALVYGGLSVSIIREDEIYEGTLTSGAVGQMWDKPSDDYNRVKNGQHAKELGHSIISTGYNSDGVFTFWGDVSGNGMIYKKSKTLLFAVPGIVEKQIKWKEIE